MTEVFQNVILILLGMLIVLFTIDPVAMAKKKAPTGPDAEAQKDLEPVTQELAPLVKKGMARGLFSADDVDKLDTIKYQLMDIMTDYPKASPVAKPVFQMAQVLESRERYDDAYDFYNYVATQYASTPYGMQAKVQIARMKEKLGEKFFATK
jgi:hypothetical protein